MNTYGGRPYSNNNYCHNVLQGDYHGPVIPILTTQDTLAPRTASTELGNLVIKRRLGLILLAFSRFGGGSGLNSLNLSTIFIGLWGLQRTISYPDRELIRGTHQKRYLYKPLKFEILNSLDKTKESKRSCG